MRPGLAVLAAALAALTGGWALIAWGLVMESDTEARTLALAAYAGLVGVLAAPLARHTSTRIALECAAAVLAVWPPAYSPDIEVTAMALTIVGTAHLPDRRDHAGPDTARLGRRGRARLRHR